MTPPGLDELLSHPSLWRASGSQAAARALPSGFRRLDDRLPGGGWPLDTLVEILLPAHGVGEINLLLPALRVLAGGSGVARRWIAWIGPPHLPYAPALASAGLDPGSMLVVQPRGQAAVASQGGNGSPRGQSPLQRPDPALWAMEQALRSRACAAALGWTDAADSQSLRRLKLAAEEGGSLGFLFRPLRRAAEPSPASLRLSLEPRDGLLDLHILKCRGGVPGKVEALLGRRGES